MLSITDRSDRCDLAWTARRWWAWSSPALAALALVGVAIVWQGGSVEQISVWPAHQAAFLAMNGHSTTLPASLWSGLTLLGDTAVLMPLLALFLLRKPQVWAAVLASVPAGALISVLGKHWASVPRPAALLDPTLFTLIGPALHHNSFPSGHSISAFAAAVAVLATLLPSLRASRAWLVLAAAVMAALAIAVSRIAVGAHWPLDVVAGAAGGWLAGLSGAGLARRTAWWRWLLVGKGHWAASAGLAIWGLLLLARAHDAAGGTLVLALSGLCGLVAAVALLLTRPHQVLAQSTVIASVQSDTAPLQDVHGEHGRVL